LIDWPPNRGLTVSHWPRQLGYFAASPACAPFIVMPPIVAASTAAKANPPVALPHNIIILPALSDSLLDRDGLTQHGAHDIPPRARMERRGLRAILDRLIGGWSAAPQRSAAMSRWLPRVPGR
jgi:hypothetical protein